MHTPILGAVVALILWTFAMWLWLYATRLPAIIKGGIVYDPNRPASEFMDRIPPRVRWKADNYNHLHEQPTIFYALAITLALLGAGGGLNATLAWAYVGLRVVHSLIQATVNKVEARFAVFVLASLVLFALAVRAALILFGGPSA
ncbi:MAPEG family protein [Rhizorhabdus dicambivorans]|uniref:MAPEG family protein n=1 Tax=Rhizorhabdus dicambivorans TaxID=1850238 RepID=A0A2A4FW60_9SPHN|nr:MAPEG family protein [Rhizorhabdus dicambivorans]ATE65591.1 MAPEG family protein [Rhizorhabdus dicambivorans]PCE41934.1 MAPEG family protein [Rhizorhabdus dicambivorans]